MCSLRSHRSRKYPAPNQGTVVQVFTVRAAGLNTRKPTEQEYRVWRYRLPIEQADAGSTFGAEQSGAIIPFPLARRSAFIDRHARHIATMRPEVGERYLDRQLRIQFENLQRRGIDLDTINREIVAMDAAIRTALWRAVITRGQR
jgi:hypothetical protein